MIAEVETDKATMEVECFEDGILIKQYCKEGEEVPVGGAIAAIGEAGEAAPSVESPTESAAPESSTPETTQPAAEVSTPVETVVETPAATHSEPILATSSTSNDRVKASPLARKIAGSKGIV